MKPLEKTIQRHGVVAMQALGVVLLRRNVISVTASHNGKNRVIRAGQRGQSDTYGWAIESGRHVEIEWKRPGNRPTLDQLAWLRWCTETGAIAFWSDNVETAEKVMVAMLAGGEIEWRDNGGYDVIMP